MRAAGARLVFTRRRLVGWLMLGAIGVAALILGLPASRADAQTENLLRARALVARLLVDDSQLQQLVLLDRYATDLGDAALDATARRLDHDAGSLARLPLAAPLVKQTQAYAIAATDERGKVRAFEVGNAVLRSSTRAFLNLMQRLLPRLPDQGPHRRLQHTLGRLAIGITQHLWTASPHDIRPSDLRAMRTTLEQAAAALPRQRPLIARVLDQVEMIAGSSPVVAAAMRSIAQLDTRSRLTRIQSALDAGLVRQRRVHQRERAAAIVLLALAASALLALLSRYVLTLHASHTQAAQLRKLSKAVEQSPASIVITDLDGTIEYVNEAFVRNSGYSRDEAIGANPRLLQSGRTPRQTYRAMWDTLTSGQVWSGELINRRRDGSEYVESVVIAPVRRDDDTTVNYVAVKTDITRQKESEATIRHLAYCDTLTGLPNRVQFTQRLEQALSAARRAGNVGALLMLDMDHFKQLNDTRGHDAGDRFLIQVAQRLRNAVREEDTVGRLGGDEFIVLAEGLAPDAAEAAMHAERLGLKLIGVVGEPLPLDRDIDLYTTTASIGVTLFDSAQVSVETLLKQADLALYKAKEHGRNTLRFFDPEMQHAIDARAELEAAMRGALERGGFELHYQPQLDVDGRVVGAEALIRWRRDDGGLVPPAAFIPVAEDSGLIVRIGDWVLHTACAQLAAWAALDSCRDLTLAVNVSARQFHEAEFVARVRHAVQQHGVDPARLTLELTESVVVRDVQAVVARMAELKGIGIALSLDDFGTGYSSLSYIKQMEIDEIKIDQTFVRDIEHDPDDAAIVRAILAMRESLRLDAVAEGVETLAQRDFLAANGCRKFQGFLFGKAMPAAQWRGFINARPASAARALQA